MLESKVTERQSLQGVEGDHRSHHQQVFGMFSIAEIACYGCDETEDKQKEKGREASYHGKAGREYGIRLFTFIVGKTEKRCLHAKRQHYKNQCRIGIHICTDAIIARCLGHVVRVERYEQIVEESPYDAR